MKTGLSYFFLRLFQIVFLYIYRIVELTLSSLTIFKMPQGSPEKRLFQSQSLTILFRIVGGFEAVPGSWLWAAYLRWRGRANYESVFSSFSQ